MMSEVNKSSFKTLHVGDILNSDSCVGSLWKYWNIVENIKMPIVLYFTPYLGDEW